MIRKFFLLSVILGFSSIFVRSQSVFNTADLFRRTDTNSGQLNINQDPALDTLIGRYILKYKNLEDKNGYAGMEGFRIQIYSSSNRNAREESGKAKAEFMNMFPDIASYQLFAEPGYYKIRVGNYRTKTEAIKQYLMISKAFPDAYIVPDIINFPDTN
jgi:hypothetical protein